MISFGAEVLRINTAKNYIEVSTNGGRSWTSRCSASSYGTFIDLLAYGSELLAVTSKGVYVSTNVGRSWSSRCTSSSYGDFMILSDVGGKLMAQTTKGLYVSSNSGRSWTRK